VWIAALAIAALSAALLVAGSVSAQASTVTVTMGPAVGPAGGGDQTGTVTLTDMGAQTQVVVDIDPSPDGAAVEQPAHIHASTCSAIGAVEYPLTNVVNGQSTTVVAVSLATLQAGTFSINVHKSGAEIGVYTSCGDIPKVAASTTAAATTAVTAGAVPSTGGPPSTESGLSAAYLLVAAAVLVSAGGAGFTFAARRR
jgi:hypothetical protein